MGHGVVDLESRQALQRQTLYVDFCKQMILNGLVALTGIEWVSSQFSWYQFGLSSSLSVFLVHDESSPDLYKTLWCDPRVTAEAKTVLVFAEVVR